jgi:hypothetical protein
VDDPRQQAWALRRALAVLRRRMVTHEQGQSSENAEMLMRWLDALATAIEKEEL